MTRRPRIEDLTEFAVPEQVALSPDGNQVVYVLRTIDAAADRTEHALWRVPSAGGEARRLTRGTSDRAPAWSPDGTKLAFLRAQDGPPQLWLLPADGGEPEQLTTLPLGAGTPSWSPDGERIAFSSAVDIAAAADEDDETRERRGHAPIVTERLDYQADGAGLLRTIRQHLHVVDVASKKCRQVTEGDWHAGDPSWSPDSRKLAFGAGTAPDADLRPTAPAYLLDVSDEKATPQLAGLTEGLAGPILWTADSAALIVVGTSDGPVGHAGLLRLPLDGGEVSNLAAPLDRNVMPGGPGYPGALPVLVDDGGTVLFCVRDRGCTHLYAVPVDGGAPRHVLGGPGDIVSGLSVANGQAVVVLTTATSYGEVVKVDLSSGEAQTLTEHSADVAEVFPRVEREFTVSDGTKVSGWLIRDPDAAQPQPLLLDVHGGPHNAWNGAADEAHLYHQELAARGWAILLVNPRGSDGYGEQFFTAALGHWGTADAADFLEPLDELVAEGIADPKRLAVAGYSYGGFMTCYLTSRDDRFAAAVAGGVVSDLTSMAGTSDSGHFLSAYELGGPPEPERYAEMSPLSKVNDVRTPTLVLHGAADARCPIGQAEQWHTALREQGVPAQLVLYPDADHLFIIQGRPSHRLDFNRRIRDWVDQYAGDVAGPRRPRIDAQHWQRRLTTLAARHGVPGATLGILRVRVGVEDELVEAATGVLNKDTGVPVTTDSLFQIGSMTKVWTATLALQLVDEGLLELDAPIADVLPELALRNPDVAKQVTMRHLLTHTSGIDGDVFTDTGRGDDCLEKYVDLLAEVDQNHPLGATWSYCNSGFSLAGRVIEKLTGGSWDQALRDRLYKPLKLEHTVTLPEEALLYRAAVGHVGEPGQEPSRAPVWGLPRALGPAGLVTSTAADALAFARMHLTGGLAADGTRVLSEESVAAMADKHADLPDKYSLGDSWGLGWIRFGWDGHRLIGHDGNTIGQAAFLRVLPEQGLAVTLLTNGGNARDLYEDLYREIFAELADVAMPRPLAPPAESVEVDVHRHVGRYDRASVLGEVFVRDGQAVLRQTITGPLAELMPDPVHEFVMTPVDDSGDLFVVREPESLTWSPVTFYSLPTGEQYLHFGVRATPKVG
ncbi:beta-lactamase [Kribbella flavida DSM 17836]|uniref:Beta-lactamase n=1 Tax=Kribbella flavida (strain DSM 17836 / JCM 10339 / NBRC 14399) TaxID=479435 RepID=D2Q1Y6_KRIFD|nr:serine hydrolase [Kribbella flavida]ADB33932.1 beta-lactamase [Kribbella flavida DSM 17836]